MDLSVFSCPLTGARAGTPPASSPGVCRRSVCLAALLALSSACTGEIIIDTGRALPGLVDAGPAEGDAGPPDDGTDGAEPPIGEDSGSGDRTPDAGPGGTDAGPPPPPPGPARTVWKAALIAGDNSIVAFDNARETMHGLFVDDGVRPEHTVQLSRSSRSGAGVLDMSVDNLMNAMLGLDVGEGEGCAIFMTSHGSPSGFYIEGRSTMAPRDLAWIVDEACGDRPTVILVSACYSGVFLDPLRAPNRIILTAARPDRTSFGCSAGATYTYWDGCLIESYDSVETWQELYDTVTACVERREAGGFTPSEPQAYFGDEVRDLRVFDR